MPRAVDVAEKCRHAVVTGAAPRRSSGRSAFGVDGGCLQFRDRLQLRVGRDVGVDAVLQRVAVGDAQKRTGILDAEELELGGRAVRAAGLVAVSVVHAIGAADCVTPRP
jgi:hypothetical protein